MHFLKVRYPRTLGESLRREGRGGDAQWMKCVKESLSLMAFGLKCRCHGCKRVQCMGPRAVFPSLNFDVSPSLYLALSGGVQGYLAHQKTFTP